MFSDGRPLGGPSAVPFPEDAPPFPETADFFYGQLIPPSVISHPPHFPPQKLRPVRSFTQDRSEPAAACTQLVNGGASLALGFIPGSQLSFPDFQFHSSFPDTGGADDILAALRQVKPTEGFDFLMSELKKQIPPLDSTSSSSEDTDDARNPANRTTQTDGKKSSSKKRKRLESFLEDLMAQVMNKQEEMHKQLIEVMEKREAERISREETWRRQEIELTTKQEAIRAQEATRNLALISFIQNAMGVQDIQVPQQQLQSSPSMEDDGEIQSRSKPGNKRWPKAEVQALITLRCAFDDRFRNEGLKKPLWGEISAGLAKMGYCRNARKCKEKWLNIIMDFKSATGNTMILPPNAKNRPFFQELEILYKNGFIN